MSEAASTTNLTYERLFEILRAEKNAPALQKISPTFFEDIQTYIHAKRELIAKSQRSDNVFAKKDQEDTAKQLANAKKLIKMIYDLREKKIVTMALNKSRTASTLIDTSGLHEKERQMFTRLVDLLDAHRKELLDEMLKGNAIKQEKPVKEGEMQMVRFLDDVETFVDAQGNTYGPFHEEDIATIPTKIANNLEDKHKVQFIDPA